MKDNEIIKDCPFCGGKGEHQFFYNDHTIYCTKCGASARLFYPTKKEALEAWNNRGDDDLINRLKAEVERYKHSIKLLENDVKTAKSEAYKEFAERLKKETQWLPLFTPIKEHFVTISQIDNLLKEMAGAE